MQQQRPQEIVKYMEQMELRDVYIKKIRKGVHKEPHVAENWIVWGLILRTAGKYRSAQHKFERALKLEPENQTAQFEMELVSKMIYFDKILPMDATLEIQPLNQENDQTA